MILPDGMNLNQKLVKEGSRVVLIVSEGCAGRYPAGQARDRGEESLVGQSAAGTAVRVEKAEVKVCNHV